MSEKPDKKAIACNYLVGTKTVAKGALAYESHQSGGSLPERIWLVVRSRGGRWIHKWENMKRVGNFRLKTIPPEHPRYNDDRIRTEYLDEWLENLKRAKAEVGDEAETHLAGVAGCDVDRPARVAGRGRDAD